MSSSGALRGASGMQFVVPLACHSVTITGTRSATFPNSVSQASLVWVRFG